MGVGSGGRRSAGSSAGLHMRRKRGNRQGDARALVCIRRHEELFAETGH